jgi:hypothetical protein
LGRSHLAQVLLKLHERDQILNCEEKLRMLGNVAAGMHYLASKMFIHRVSRHRQAGVPA